MFFWYVYCLKIRLRNLTCALLTCDSVVALQADILSQGQANAYFAWNYTMKGENHISRVYAKCGQPNWNDLCESEKEKLDKEYNTLLKQIETIRRGNQIMVDIGDGRDMVDSAKVLFEALSVEVETILKEIDDAYTTLHDKKGLFFVLKKFALNSPIKNRIDNRFVLKHSHTKLCAGRHPCYKVNEKLCNLGAKMVSIQYSHLRDNTDLDVFFLNNKIQGGRNPFREKLEEEDEPFLFYDLNISYDVAIENLQNFILKVLHELTLEMVKKYNIPVPSDERVRHTISDFIFGETTERRGQLQTYVYERLGRLMGGSGFFLYNYLTYEFHANPDYSSENIRFLCSSVINITIESYSIILEIYYQYMKEKKEQSGARLTRADEVGVKTAVAVKKLPHFLQHISPSLLHRLGIKGGRKTRRIRKNFTLKHKKRSMRKTQRRRNIIK